MTRNDYRSVSHFCKLKALGTKTRVPKFTHADTLVMATELRRIGVNLNQVAKHANITQSVSEGKIEGIQEELRVLWQLLS